MPWIYYLLLLAALLLGLLLTVLTLPGLWIMLAAAAIYAWATAGHFIGLWSLLTLFLLALLAEVVEFLASGMGAGKAGGSKWGMLGAILGGLLGGILLSFLIPIPLIGTIIGVCLGSFLGATSMEILIGRQMAHSLRIGLGAARGRLFGLLLKLAFALAMLIVALCAGFPHRTAPAPTTLPSPLRPSPSPGKL